MASLNCLFDFSNEVKVKVGMGNLGRISVFCLLKVVATLTSSMSEDLIVQVLVKNDAGKADSGNTLIYQQKVRSPSRLQSLSGKQIMLATIFLSSSVNVCTLLTQSIMYNDGGFILLHHYFTPLPTI